MSNDNIEIIRERHARDDRWRNLPSMICPQAHDDRATLLAEDERHRAEIERLRKAMTNMMIGWRHIRREREEYRAEVERHRVQIERMTCDRNKAVVEVDKLRVDTELLRRSNETLVAKNERLRDVLRSVCVHPSGDRIVKISFISEGCTLTFPVVPSTTWSLEVLIEFDKARRKELEGKP